MKIQIKQTPTVFQPRTVELVLETQEELDALGTLFNISAINLVLAENGLGRDTFDIHQAFKDNGADIKTKLSEMLKELKCAFNNPLEM